MKKLLLISMLFVFCTITFAGDPLDPVIVRPNADGGGNSLWVMTHTLGGGAFDLNASNFSYKPLGYVGNTYMVGDVTGGGIDDIIAYQQTTLVPAVHSSLGLDGVGHLGDGSEWSQIAWQDPSIAKKIMMGDINGDSFSDVVWAGSWNAVTLMWVPTHSVGGYGNYGGIQYNAYDMVAFGNYVTDTPIMGDWNGDGIKDIGIYNQGLWSTYFSTPSGLNAGSQGPNGAYGVVGIPLTGDLNGDGRTDGITIVDNGYGDALWYVGYTDATGQIGGAGASYGWLGKMTDQFLVGDINGDGKDDIGIFRDGLWEFGFTSALGVPSQGIVNASQYFGQAGDVALLGNFGVPEPTSMVLLGLGTLLLRRKK